MSCPFFHFIYQADTGGQFILRQEKLSGTYQKHTLLYPGKSKYLRRALIAQEKLLLIDNNSFCRRLLISPFPAF